jgi:copper chaperone CopZ
MIVLSIKEMHCAGCVTTIDRALTQVSGVRSVKVNLSDKSAAIGGDVSAELLIDAVSKTGYKAILKYSEEPSHQHSKESPPSDLMQLYPLFLIFFYITMATLLMNQPEFSILGLMYDFMGLFYIIFSFFKFLDYKNFPQTFSMYDPIAKAIPAYGWIYPFIETGLGLALVFRIAIYSALVATLIILGATTVGVVRALSSKSQVQCACLGTALQLPMTKATLIENSIMLIMASWMLFSGFGG